MNTVTLAQSAYARASSIAPSPRDTEYRAFAMVTRLLSEHAEVTRTDFTRLAEAIHQNRRLWGVLAADAAGNANGLPEELRAQVISLADFTNRHSTRVLQEGVSPAVLVEINTAVMRGLRAGPSDGR